MKQHKPRLPAELYITIFHWIIASRLYGAHERRHTLCQISLASRLFHVLIQPFLFDGGLEFGRRERNEYDPAARTFMAALQQRDPAARLVIPWVKAVTVTTPSPSDNLSRYPGPRRLLYLQALPRLQNLTRLTLLEMTVPRVFLKCISSFRDLTSLRLIRCSLYEDIKPSDFQLFKALSLEEIEFIQSWPQPFPVIRSFAASVIKASLRRFTTDIAAFTRILMIHPSAPALTHFFVTNLSEADVPTVVRFLSDTPSITHLAILNLNHKLPELPENTLPSLSSLHGDGLLWSTLARPTVTRARIPMHGSSWSFRGVVEVNSRMLLNLSSTLTELHLGWNIWSTVMTHSFPQLRKLCIEYANNPYGNDPSNLTDSVLSEHLGFLTEVQLPMLEELEFYNANHGWQKPLPEKKQRRLVSDLQSSTLQYVAFGRGLFWYRLAGSGAWSSFVPRKKTVEQLRSPPDPTWDWGFLHPEV
ncbi:hypothetical protein C8J56DRAFT_1163913 [Mycena floridula]|nr:hypothetical protein C8J56DRAFT_1163913 [Mycena floridula]